MKTFRYTIMLLALAALVSCGTVGLAARVQDTAVGMSKAEVTKQLGTSYDIIESLLAPDGGVVEVLLFTDGISGVRYEYEFYNDTLVRYTKVKSLTPADDKKPHDHHHH